MKLHLSTAALFAAVLALSDVASATWFYPSPNWKPITWTLPGSTFRKRSDTLSTRQSRKTSKSYRDIYAACSTKNMISRFNRLPINGYQFGGAAIGVRSQQPDFRVFEIDFYDASNAYDCCVIAQKDPTSALFFYQSAKPGDVCQEVEGVQLCPKRCQVLTTSANQFPRDTVLIMGANYNGTAPRGTNYYNYLGNGRYGPGVTRAYNTADRSLCQDAFTQPSDDGNSLASSIGQGYCTQPVVDPVDLGDVTPAG